MHHSLHRTPMMMGLPQDIVFLGGLIMIATVVAFQMALMAIVICIATTLIATPILRRLFAKEPDIQAILPRALSYKAFYPRQARESATPYVDSVGKRE